MTCACADADVATISTADMLASWDASSAVARRRHGRGSVFGQAAAAAGFTWSSLRPLRKLPSAAMAAAVSLDSMAAQAPSAGPATSTRDLGRAAEPMTAVQVTHGHPPLRKGT